MSQTIQSILEDAAKRNIVFDKSAESMSWYINRAKGLTGVTSSSLMREFQATDHRSTSQLRIGGMYMFFYDPKHKKTLPYFDRFPCIFMVGGKDGGYAGINLHYLPYKQRALLMDALLKTENDTRLPERKKLRISYDIMKASSQMKWFKPCYKHYLNNHVRSKLVRVPHEEWHVAAFLPVHEFEKKTAQEVWAESMAKIKSAK